MVKRELCNHCHTPIAIRNQSGFCDHLRYPESCEICFGKPMPEAWEEQFAPFWGLAPEGSLKYKKGQEVKAFIADQRQQAKQEGYTEGFSKGHHEGYLSGTHRLGDSYQRGRREVYEQMIELYKPILEVGKYLADMGKEIPGSMWTKAVSAMETIQRIGKERQV